MRVPQRYVACSIMLPAVQRTAPWTLVLVVLLCFRAVPVQSHNDKVARSRTTPTPPLRTQEGYQLMDAAGIGATSLAAAAAAAAEFLEDSQESPNDAEIAITDNHNHSKQANEAIRPGEIGEIKELEVQEEVGGSHLLASDHPMIVNGANLLLDTSQRFASPLGSGATAQSSVNLTRHHDGDLFRTSGVTNCNMDTCVGLSSGTAGLVRPGAHNGQEGRVVGGNLAGGSGQSELGGKRQGSSSGVGETCECGCFPYLRTYREDLGICVDDIHECTLSPFVSGSSSEKIPFVFLPLRGQIIYPSREIRFSDIRTPVCAVTGAQYLTTNGWSDLRNPIDTDYPFRIYRDEGRSFLQWLGDRDLRQKMQGRLIVVHLVCREMTIALNATAAKDQLKPPQNVFSPCVAFRVNGSPVKFTQNVSEVLFQSETTSTLASTSEGMTTKEYVVICLCSLLLGLIYVASVFLYLHMKKRKSRDRNSAHMRNSLNDLENEINYPKNDQVTFGAPFNRSGSLYSANSMGTSNEPRSRNSIGTLKEEMGIVKNNPLLQHFPQLSDHHSGFASDISNSNSECEMEGPVGNSLSGSMNAFHEKLKQMQTSALVHPQLGASNGGNGSPQGRDSANSQNQNNANDDDAIESASTQSQETECLPAENCSIVEEVMTEEKLENLRAMLNGTMRKKLYFNPAYFEPHLLAHPPPAAVEFLQKIREVIAIAKYKMAMKRYEPSLIGIPEEGSTGSNISAAQLPSASGECGDSHSKRSGDKRNSIEKWLKSVSETDPQSANEGESANNRPQPGQAEDSESSSRGEPPTSSASTSHPKSCSPAGRPNVSRKEITPPKERPPPPPVPAKPTAKEDNSSDKGRKQLVAASESTSSQHFSTNITTIPISRQYEAFSSLSMAANIYGFAEMGSEIYNNPRFNLHDSPSASMRSRGSSHHSKCSRKRLDVLDQYAAASTPTSLTSAERQHYDMLRNMKQIPDNLYDSLGRESNNGNYHLDIPTPDYDSTIEKKIKDIYNSTQSSAPSVPTPDYSTLSRKSLKQGQQPDSPIYRRKSPQYLIVDYETDSMERIQTTKRKSSQSSSSPSSDVSSQLSPSLSTALPLEEEMEISHAVYDKVNGFRKEGDRTKKLTGGKSDRSASKHKEIAARIKYDTPFLGSMTIEVEHEPPSDMEPSTDSEQFDPDTLDRNQRQRSFCDVKSWTNQGKLVQGNAQQSSHIQPGVHTTAVYSSAYMLKANHSFRSQSSTRSSTDETRVSFSSLRELYQSQMSRPNGQKNCKCGGQASLYMAQNPDRLTEQGRLLTLEAKHSRRQRVTEPPKTPSPPPVVQISNVPPNKTTIKITTPKVSRASTAVVHTTDSITSEAHSRNNSFRGDGQNFKRTPSISSTHITPPSTIERLAAKKAAPPPPPASLTVSIVSQPGPSSLPTSTTTTSSSQYSQHFHEHHTYQNQRQYGNKQAGTAGEEETMSNHSQSTEVTGVSDTVQNSDLEGSRQNTLSSCNAKLEFGKGDFPEYKNQVINEDGKNYETSKSGKKFPPENPDYGAMFNTKINGLRGDYSLTKYMHRRKLSEQEEKLESHSESESPHNNNNNNKSAVEPDITRADVLSLGSRSNQSSSRLSDRTKEMYRNAGVPVGIAYPQRSVAASSNNPPNGGASNSGSSAPSAVPVQTVYRCEIEPVQLTHGMQIAMGLKDRAKKAKDLKNAWKKFVSLAASKFSPTQSPAPPFEKKLPGFLEGLDRDEGISSLIDENPRVSTPKSSYSAPASQNYYEQRFGARPQEMDSGYMSADSGEVYKRSFYDRYNFKMMTERDHIIRVDTIEDNSDGGSTLTDRHNGVSPSGRRGSILDSNRFEDLENIGEPPPNEVRHQPVTSDDNSDGDSDRTVTRRGRRSGQAVYSSEDEQGLSTSYGSSETDGETNADDMWESGAESIETHSVLYKQVRKS